MDQGYDQRTHTMELLLRVCRDLLHYQRGADNNGAYLWCILERSGCLVAGQEEGHLGWVIACHGSGVDLVLSKVLYFMSSGLAGQFHTH